MVEESASLDGDLSIDSLTGYAEETKALFPGELGDDLGPEELLGDAE